MGHATKNKYDQRAVKGQGITTYAKQSKIAVAQKSDPLPVRRLTWREQRLLKAVSEREAARCAANRIPKISRTEWEAFDPGIPPVRELTKGKALRHCGGVINALRPAYPLSAV
jgi:hypothetical protein